MTGDYGIAIILITLITQTFLLPLTFKQRSQAKKQQSITEKISAIKDKYKKDPQKMEYELQKLYQDNGLGTGNCLMLFLPLPIMIGLYRVIRSTSTATSTTMLLPWISSLLQRDHTFILPLVTLIMQCLPQLYPYMNLFKELRLQKTSPSQILVLLFMNSLYIFTIPSGVGLYCLTSGIFQALSQFAMNLFEIRKNRLQGSY